MKDVKKISIPQEHTDATCVMYMGTFIPPMSEDRFFNSPKVQYDVFKKSMKEYYKAIEESGLAKLVGKEIGTETLTMSGLLALVSQAGIKGAKGWLNKPKERERFPYTTQTFLETNGIF